MAAITRLVRKFRSDRGAELIELAMITPLLMLFFAGIFDFAMIFRAWEVVTNAAREGARVGVLPGYDDDANVIDRVEQYMQVSGLAASCSAGTVTGNTCNVGANPECTVCVFTDTVTTGAGEFAARVVHVQSRQNFQSLGWVADVFGGNFTSVNVGSTSSMRTEVAGTAPPP